MKVKVIAHHGIRWHHHIQIIDNDVSVFETVMFHIFCFRLSVSLC